MDSRQFSKRGRQTVIEPFDCPSLPASSAPDWEAWGGRGYTAEEAPPSLPERPAQPPAASDVAQDEDLRRQCDEAREKGIAEGRRLEREASDQAQVLAKQEFAERLAHLVESFTEARDRYLHTVEQEAVKLSLAVAARILRREAQMDPLLLTGAVRVALGQLANSTALRLRVPPTQLDLWRESVALLPNVTVKPQVIPGEGMRLGDCVLETELGSVDLGVRAQLSEIERGFFDRSSAPETSLTEEAAQ